MDEEWPFPMPTEQERWHNERQAVLAAADPVIVAFVQATIREAIRKHDPTDDALYSLGEDDPQEDGKLIIAEIAIAMKNAAQE